MTKVAIVTGGNKGIGFAIVKGLAKVFDGDVYLTARSAERGMAAVKLLAQENITVEFFPLDIDDPRSNEAIAAFMKEEYGGIDRLSVDHHDVSPDQFFVIFGSIMTL